MKYQVATDCKRAYKELYIDRLSDYVDFPNPIQVFQTVQISSEYQDLTVKCKKFQIFCCQRLLMT